MTPRQRWTLLATIIGSGRGLPRRHHRQRRLAADRRANLPSTLVGVLEGQTYVVSGYLATLAALLILGGRAVRSLRPAPDLLARPGRVRDHLGPVRARAELRVAHPASGCSRERPEPCWSRARSRSSPRPSRRPNGVARSGSGRRRRPGSSCWGRSSAACSSTPSVGGSRSSSMCRSSPSRCGSRCATSPSRATRIADPLRLARLVRGGARHRRAVVRDHPRRRTGMEDPRPVAVDRRRRRRPRRVPVLMANRRDPLVPLDLFRSRVFSHDQSRDVLHLRRAVRDLSYQVIVFQNVSATRPSARAPRPADGDVPALLSTRIGSGGGTDRGAARSCRRPARHGSRPPVVHAPAGRLATRGCDAAQIPRR